MRKVIPTGFILLTLVVMGGPWQTTARSAEAKPDTAPRWEYRVLTKEQMLDLGKKDLATGLNKLGDEGWELVAVEPAFIFKRPKGQIQKQAADLKSLIDLLETDVDALRDRVAWAERMAKKGFMSANQVQAERTELHRAELALDKARRDLKILVPEPKEPAEKERKPEK
jgi:hypothetical protein